MFLGRFCGWCLIGLSLLMASADAVMALGPGDYSGIAAGDLFTLLSGHPPEATRPLSALDAVGLMLMQWPAWAVVGPLGAALVLACRRRGKHHHRRSRSFA